MAGQIDPKAQALLAATGAAAGIAAGFTKSAPLALQHVHRAGLAPQAYKFTANATRAFSNGAGIVSALSAGATAVVGGPAVVAAAVAAAPVVLGAAVVGAIGFGLYKLFGED